MAASTFKFTHSFKKHRCPLDFHYYVNLNLDLVSLLSREMSHSFWNGRDPDTICFYKLILKMVTSSLELLSQKALLDGLRSIPQLDSFPPGLLPICVAYVR